MKTFLILILFLLAAVAPALAGDNIVYTPATLTGISDVLFRAGVLKTSDPAAVEEYIRIHHCGLHDQYSTDDFAWARIRDSQARQLEVMLPDMPQGLEITSALHLDNYDLTTNQFIIAKDDRMQNMALINAWQENSGNLNPCDYSRSDSFVPRMHPLTLTVKIDTPFNLSGIPMNRATADTLISNMNKRGNTKRETTLVFRLHVLGIDPLGMATDPLRRAVLGQLDEVRIYEGPDRKNLLFRKDFAAQRVSKDKN